MKTIHLSVTPEVAAQLRFLSAAYGAPGVPKPAARVVSDLIEGAFAACYTRLERQHAKLQAQRAAAPEGATP